MHSLAVFLLSALALALTGAAARAFEMPPVCAEFDAEPDLETPLETLREQADKQLLVSPIETVAMMCATIPRVLAEHGENSIELAWWVGSLATPLIAFMDRSNEAIPLLEFARPLFERHLGPYANEIADIHVAYAWISFRQGRSTDAVSAWEAALAIREHNPGERRIELQKVLVGLALARVNLRQFDAARAALERAEAILVENGETISDAASAIQNSFTNLAIAEEDYHAARRHAERQIEIELSLPGRATQPVPGYALLGYVLERLDEFEASEVALREALRLAEAEDGPFQRHYLAALTQLANALAERGRAAEALPFAERALELGEATLGADAPRLVRVLGILGEIQRALGRLPEALRHYERASRIVEANPGDTERQSVVSYYRGFAGLQASLGDHERARQLLTAGLAAAGDDSTLATERGLALLALAISPGTSDVGERERSLLVALDLLRMRLPDSHPAVLRVVAALCGLEVERGAASTPHCDEAARRIAPPNELEPTVRVAVLEQLSRRAEQRSEHEQALGLATRALAAAATLGTPDPQWRAYFRLARLLSDRADMAFPIFLGKQSITEIERLRSYFVADDRRFERGFLADKGAVYRQVADWLLEAGRMDEGLAVLSLLKSEELHDFALRGAADAEGEPRLALTAAELDMQRRMEAELATDAAAGEEIERLSRLRESERISVQEQQRLNALLESQLGFERLRTERLQAMIEASDVAPERDRGTANLRITEALEPFGADAAFAVFLLTEDHLRIIVATRTGQTEHLIEVNAAGLRRDIGRFLDAIRGREAVEPMARALYDLLARPVDMAAREAGAERLVLWLDGALRYVPFDALHDGEGYLADRYALQVYAKSTAPVVGPGAGGAMAPAVRGLGVTRAVGGFPALPAMADELCHVVNGPIAGLASPSSICPLPVRGAGALLGEGFADAAFTALRLKSMLAEKRDFSVLHLGTHFSLRPGNAIRSFLVLGDGERLTLDQIGELDFSGLELITLSACETGLGGAVADDGREVEGLSALVQRRGARRVVGSLWKVEDTSTAELMRRLYAGLAAPGTDLAGALRSAQSSVRALRVGDGHPFAHPYYWAGFFVAGSQP